MLPSPSLRAIWRLIAVTCLIVLPFAGCGSSDNPQTEADAAADSSGDTKPDASGKDASVDVGKDAGVDSGPDANGTGDAGNDGAPVDKTPDAVMPIDTIADSTRTIDVTGGDSADVVGTSDAGADATLPIDVTDASPDATLDTNADAIKDGPPSDAGVAIVVGGTYGAYVVNAITIAGAPPANYTFAVTSPTAGSVSLFRDGTPVKSVSYNWQTTVSATDSSMFYTFDFPGYLAITIRKAGSGTTNLYEMDQSIFNGADFLVVVPGQDGSTADGGSIAISVGGTYAPYVVESIAMTGAPNGAYTFHVASPTAGSVELRRDGTPVTTVSYLWQTTVSATDSNSYYTFNFTGYFSITIRKAGTGTTNLYEMDQSIFDGAHVLTVMNDGGGAD